MVESWLDFAKQETERLEVEIEELQGKIRLHNETRDAWDTILRNSGSESLAAYLGLANAEAERLNGEIEAVQDEIRRHLETKDAWETVSHSAGSQPRAYRGTDYVKGEDVRWHLQRLDIEIEALQEEIRIHNQTKSAWETIVRDTGSELRAVCLELACSETALLDKTIEAVQENIRRHQETRGAWDTILRNAVSESRHYQGSTYVKGWDGQWHLQQSQVSESNEEDWRTRVEDDRSWTSDAVSKVNSVRQALLDACERTFRAPQKQENIPAHGKEQFQSLGLR
ncbi:MAG TPA: hypothetical protein VGF01_22305 [Terracidiphilus sp.]